MIALWRASGLTRPWNDSAADFSRAIEGTTTAIAAPERRREALGLEPQQVMTLGRFLDPS